jgi:hypothetical protein
VVRVWIRMDHGRDVAMRGTTGFGSAEFGSGPKISGTTIPKVIRFCSAACRTGFLYFGTGTEVVPGNPAYRTRP